MLNSEPPPDDSQHSIDIILRSGATGAIVLAGITTALVMAIWFAFYFLVFVPRAGGGA